MLFLCLFENRMSEPGLVIRESVGACSGETPPGQVSEWTAGCEPGARHPYPRGIMFETLPL